MYPQVHSNQMKYPVDVGKEARRSETRQTPLGAHAYSGPPADGEPSADVQQEISPEGDFRFRKVNSRETSLGHSVVYIDGRRYYAESDKEYEKKGNTDGYILLVPCIVVLIGLFYSVMIGSFYLTLICLGFVMYAIIFAVGFLVL